MKRMQILTILAIVVLFGFGSYATTLALFSNTANSTSNTFAAAAVFPSLTPTFGPSITPSVGPSLTPTVTITPSVTITPTGTQVSPGDVVINEVMWMGTQGNASDEWIELRNMTGSSIDLSGWVIDNLGSGAGSNVVIPAGKSIDPNGFFLIANDTKATGKHNVDPDVVINVSLLNPGERLTLRISTGGTIIDDVNAATGWFAGTDGSGQTVEKSMERNTVPGNGSVAGNWHTATTAANMDAGTREIATPRTTNSL